MKDCTPPPSFVVKEAFARAMKDNVDVNTLIPNLARKTHSVAGPFATRTKKEGRKKEKEERRPVNMCRLQSCRTLG